MTKAQKQRLAFHDAIAELQTKIEEVRIVLVMVTAGRARESLEAHESDELDWMLMRGMEAVKEASSTVADVVLGGTHHG